VVVLLYLWLITLAKGLYLHRYHDLL